MSEGTSAVRSERPVGVTLELAENWDASLSYDLLQQDAASVAAPIFVGRQELLGPIVNAIGQPDRRGTYLVSGYRGAGKTSLVIESARQARSKLAQNGWQLLPVVLNVSEVSASLANASEPTVGPLQIDARRLLTALLRQLLNRVPTVELPSRDDAARDELADEIGRAYRKASAAQYVERSQQRTEASRSETSESKRDVNLPNLLKLVAAGSGVAAIGVGAGVVLDPIAAAATALAAAAVGSFQWSRSVSQASEHRETAEIELSMDNSVQQLENDLKDIFSRLQEQRLRTIVVLEELDKVDDSEGAQLDSVIRYFKNLFTQAPALFFFLTDKQYFDLIATKIDAARTKRTYSIEHTFFTHRVFVNRPTVRDCFDYLKKVADTPDGSEAIEEIATSDVKRVRELESMDLRERLIRVLLFRAQNHIFDLKNEMRRYMHVDERGSVLACDDESLPLNEQAAAAFQFLVEQKARSYGFRGGREYANEVLRNCLLAVFNDTSAGEPSALSDFYPLQGPGGDQLGSNEEERIREAVASLVEELERGGALERDLQSGSFTWQENAAVLFRPVARLEPHEEALAESLERSASAIAIFGDGGALLSVVRDPSAASDLVARLRQEVEDTRRREEPLPVEQASAMSSSFEAESARILGDAFEAHRERLVKRLGRELETVDTSTTGSAWRLRPLSGAEAAVGEVYLVYGTAERARQAVAARAASASGERRCAVVHVVVEQRGPGGPASPFQRQAIVQEWETLFAQAGAAQRVLASVVPLAEDLSGPQVAVRWTQLTADELLLAEAWARQFGQGELGAAETPQVGHYLLQTTGAAEKTSESLEGLLEEWLASSDQLLCWVTPEPSLADVERAFGKPIYRDGRPLVYLPATAAVPSIGANGVRDDDGTPQMIQRMIESARVVVGLDDYVVNDLAFSFVLPARARAVIHWTRWDDTVAERLAPVSGVSTLRVGDDPYLIERLGVLVANWDSAQARALYQIAADQSLGSAMARLVESLIDEDPPQARAWLSRLIETGDIETMIELAGALGQRSPDDARTLSLAAANYGAPNAIRQLAVDLLDEDPDQAKAWRDRLVETGSAMEIAHLADMLRERNPEDAKELYEAAAGTGSAYAMRRLVEGGLDGAWVNVKEWQRDLVATKDVPEILRLAEAVRERNPGESQALYEAAAEHGSSVAMAWLAVELVDRHPALAETWQKRIVEAGDVVEVQRVARRVLASHPDQAQTWFSLARDTLNPEIKAAVGELLHEIEPALAEELKHEKET